MLLIKHIKQLLTMAGPKGPRRGREMQHLGLIENGAILIDNDKILAVGPNDVIASSAASVDAVIDGREVPFIALPGFVDSHTHPVFAATREEEYDLRARGATYMEIARQGGGIRSSVRKVRQASSADLYQKSLPYCKQFLAFGSTTIEAKSGYGLSFDDEIKLLEVIRALDEALDLDLVPTFLGAHDVPDEFRERRGDYVSLLTERLIPEVVGRKLAVFCDVFCDVGFFSVAEARAVLTAAKRSGLKLKIHAEELGASGGAELAAELGAVSADHLEFIGDKGIEMLRASGVVATLLPGTAFNLGLKYPPARKLIEGGVPVALATDFNPGTCFTPNIQLILSIACAQMKMAPSEALVAATINGAYALGLGGSIGSLEPGKQSDIILLNLEDYRQLPYYFGVNHCRTIVKRGKIIKPI